MHNPMNGEVQMGRWRGEDSKCLETEDRVSGLVSNCQEIKRSRYIARCQTNKLVTNRKNVVIVSLVRGEKWCYM